MLIDYKLSTSHTAHTKRAIHPLRTGHGGFTITELLFVVLIIGVIVTLAIPSMRSVVRRHQDLDAASRLTLLINQIKDQAIRRNRAYEMNFQSMNAQEPEGILSVFEAASNTCQSLIEQEADKQLIINHLFGTSEMANIIGAKARQVGLSGIRRRIQDNFVTANQSFCSNA